MELKRGELQAPPTKICRHIVRSEMLEQVMTICIDSFRVYCRYSDAQNTHPHDIVLARMLAGARGDPGYLRARQSLMRAKQTCGQCNSYQIYAPQTSGTMLQNDDGFHEQQSDAESDSEQSNSEQSDESDDGFVPDPDEEFGQFILTAPPKKLLQKKGWLRGAKIHPCLLPNSKRPVYNPQQWSLKLPANFESAVQELQWDFDEYDTGPTWEEIEKYHASLTDDVELDHDQQLLLPTENVWRKIVDSGIRRVPFSLHLFYMINLDPKLLLDHTLSIGPTRDPLWRQKTLQPITGDYSLNRKARNDGDNKSRISVEDVITLGLQEMLDLAGPLGSQKSMSIFVNGKLGKKFIKIDPQKGTELGHDVYHEHDLDSFIYLSDKLKCFKTSLWIHEMPYLRHKAPISRNNHLYVELLPPRSDSDKRHNVGRQEWHTCRIPLSAIPHLPFGSIGGNVGRINVYIFWPRIVRCNQKGRYISLVPNAVQRLWLESVLIPSINEINSHAPEYTNTLSELQYKKKGEKDPGHQHPIHADNLDRLLGLIQRRITNDTTNLGIFASFFFCVDIRGVKNVIRHSADLNLLNVLENEFPMLNMDILKDRSIGECVVDLATIFRVKDDNSPKTGQWKLEHVNASYDKAGFKAGKLHHLCSLADYGSRQSEIGLERGRRVQIISRQTYHPIYEMVKRPGREPYTPTDVQAYQGKKDFRNDCISLVAQLQRGKDRSWGLRDESRVSLQGALELLSDNNYDKKVRLLQA